MARERGFEFQIGEEKIEVNVNLNGFREFLGYSRSPRELQEEVETKRNITGVRTSEDDVIMLVTPKDPAQFKEIRSDVFFLRRQEDGRYRIIMRISTPRDRGYQVIRYIEPEPSLEAEVSIPERTPSIWTKGLFDIENLEIKLPKLG